MRFDRVCGILLMLGDKDALERLLNVAGTDEPKVPYDSIIS